jgi:hypothetical protein
MEEKTPRLLIKAFFAAQNEGDRQTLRAQIEARNLELVPDQVTPEPLSIASWDEEYEVVGNRATPEIEELLRLGAALSLVLGGVEYSIWRPGQFVFEVYVNNLRDQVQTYDSLDSLIQAEGSRSGFNLEAFVVIG